MRIVHFVLTPAVLVGAVATLCGPGPRDASAEAYGRMHETVVNKFVATPGFGLARMGQTLQFVAADVSGVQSIELVGVALHDSPVAYVDDSANTRTLTLVQRASLRRLDAGEELVVQGATALGAIRARAECRRCHLGHETGDLLGAFAYRYRTHPS